MPGLNSRPPMPSIKPRRWPFGICPATCTYCRSMTGFAQTWQPSGSEWHRRPAGNLDAAAERRIAFDPPAVRLAAALLAKPADLL